MIGIGNAVLGIQCLEFRPGAVAWNTVGTHDKKSVSFHEFVRVRHASGRVTKVLRSGIKFLGETVLVAVLFDFSAFEKSVIDPVDEDRIVVFDKSAAPSRSAAILWDIVN